MKFNISLFTLLAVCLSLGSCNTIYDDLKDCPQGVDVRFFSKSTCQPDTTYLSKVDKLHLFAFDENDKLCRVTVKENVRLSRDYNLHMPLETGVYSIISWCGINDSFDIASLKKGETTKDELFFMLKNSSGEAASLDNHQVYQGECFDVNIKDSKSVGSAFEKAAVNLREQTNRINVELILDETIHETASLDDFSVSIISDNGAICLDGTIPEASQTVEYPCKLNYKDYSVKSSFTILDLVEGYDNLLVVKNHRTGKELFRGDLLENLILKNEALNLDCQNDFDIKFVIRDDCVDCETYISWTISVNNWIIYSYDTELGTDY